jgi:hypothetical protein
MAKALSMTPDLDPSGRMPRSGDEITAALASIDQALSALREPTDAPRRPAAWQPLPPVCVTAADRLVP